MSFPIGSRVIVSQRDHADYGTTGSVRSVTTWPGETVYALVSVTLDRPSVSGAQSWYAFRLSLFEDDDDNTALE